MIGLSWLVVSIVDDAVLSGSGEAVASLLSDGVAVAVVLLVGGDVVDAGVEADLVVVPLADVELGSQHIDVLNLFQMRVLIFEVPEQRFDPGLIGWRAGPAVVGSEPAQRHELPRRPRRHLGTVIRHDQQDR